MTTNRRNKNERYAKLFNSPDKGERDAQNVITKLRSRIFQRFDYDLSDWMGIVTLYAKSPLSKNKPSAKDVSQERNNINRAILDTQHMTWANFWKTLCLLSPVKIEIEVRLGWRNGLWTIHRNTYTNRVSEIPGIEQYDPSRKLTYDTLTEEEKRLTDERGKKGARRG